MTIFDKLERRMKNSIKGFLLRHHFKLEKLPTPAQASAQIIHAKIGKFSLAMREDHQLPLYLKHQEFYSMNLPRLALPILEKYPDLRMIDIGANIGDTVALTRSSAHFPILCLEGNPEFFRLLKQNMQQFKEVEIAQQLFGERNESVNAALETNIETARMQASTEPTGHKESLMSLDSFLESKKAFENAKFLKIDTDGYDMKILRGGMEYISRAKPVLFFEYDTIFLDEDCDDALGTFRKLEEHGYSDIIYYDNLGRFILSTTLSHRLLLQQLHKYPDPKTRSPIPYYDVAVFHKDDSDIAEKFISNEMQFFYKEKPCLPR